jgi:23S rRNA U2552 (ribose-2'-O)-methylase RlmE/FtsJ
MDEFRMICVKLPTVKMKKKISIKFETQRNLPPLEKKQMFQRSFHEKKEEIMNTNLYDIYRCFVNPYTLINTNYEISQYIYKITGIEARSLPDLKPKELSRAYFKLWEILFKERLLPKSLEPMVCANIAEGPGGFIHALINYRKIYEHKDEVRNKYIAISLKEHSDRNNSGLESSSKHQEGPTFESYKPHIKEFMRKYKNNMKILNISYGNSKYNDGDLNKLENIKAYAKLFELKKANFVTGDGGVPDLDDSSLNELNTTHLIYNEIVAALSVQELHGNFVLKIFTIWTRPMLELIYLISTFYESVEIVKPLTSKITSYERYIIAKDFRGITRQKLNKLYEITKKWYEIDNLGGYKPAKRYPTKLFSFRIPTEFKEAVKKFDEEYVKLTEPMFEKLEEYIRLHKEGKKNRPYFINILKKQQELAIKWYREHQIPIKKYNIIPFRRSRKL